MSDDFGRTEEVLLAQEEKLQKYADENRVLGAALEALQAKLKASEGRASAAHKRAAEAEAKLHARAAAATGRSESQQAAGTAQEVERLKRKAQNDRILLEQAERGRREAEQQLAAAQRFAAGLEADNAELRQQLAAAQRQVRQLESLQVFSDSCSEQQQRERQLEAALEQASGRAQQLEARCAGLEVELESTAAALRAAQQLAESRPLVPQRGLSRHLCQNEAGEEDGETAGQTVRPQLSPHQQRQQATRQAEEERADSLSLSDLCDLDGAPASLFGTPASVLGGRSSGETPPRRRALRQLQQAAQQRQPGQEQQAAAAECEQEAAAAEAQQSLVAELQQQLREQQRQLAVLQLQQHAALGAAEQPAPHGALQAGAAGSLQQLERQLDKLKRRNTQLQTALADASLQHARAATAAQKRVQELEEEAARLRQQHDQAAAQLSQLQLAAAVLDLEGAGGGGGGACSSEQLEQLRSELLDYATRCSAALEQSAGLLQEKKLWLEKLRAAEADVERCRAEAQQLRLQRLQLLPCSSADTGSGGSSGAPTELLLEQLLDAQAAEAALRSVLCEAREEQMAAAKALSCELRRVSTLERLRISDMAEVQRLQRRLHELQQDCWQLARSLATAKQPAAASAKPLQLKAWASAAGPGGRQ